MVKLNSLTTKLLEASQYTFLPEHLTPQVCTLSSSVSTHLQKVQQMHRGDWIHTNVYQCPDSSWGLSSVFFLQRRPTSMNSSSTALSFWPLRVVLSAMYHFQSSLLDARFLIPVTQQSIRRSHCLESVSCWLLMLMDWAIFQMHSLNLLSIHSVVKPSLPCQIPMVSAPHWQTPTLAFSGQVRTCRIGISIPLVSAMTDFGNHKASDYIVSSQRWSLINWWISNTCYSKPASWVLNSSLRVIQCGSSGQKRVSKVLEILSKVDRQGRYIYKLGGYSWSGDIILIAIQLWNDALSIIWALWFVDRMLKFITTTNRSMLCSDISLVCPCSRSCNLQWWCWMGI